MFMDLSDVFGDIEQNLTRYLQELKDACRQPSISAQGVGLAEMASLLQERMEAARIATRQIRTEGGVPVLYGEVKGASPRTLLFYNHYDVQPPDPLDQWTSEPFSPREEGGKIFARGVSDDKGNIMARVQAVESYLRVRGELPLTVKFLVEGEEEIGSPNLARLVEANRELLRADAGIWEAGHKDYRERPVLQLGVKGICYLELEFTGARSDLHSSNATVVPNPAWRLVWALSTLKNEREEILVEGFYDAVRPPAPEEVSLLEKDPMPEQEMKRDLGIDDFLQGLSGVELTKRYFLSPTCTICGLTSGYGGPGSKTVLPSRAVGKVDFRLVPDQVPDDIEKKVIAHLHRHGFHDVTVRKFSHEEPARTPVSAPIVKVAREAAGAIYGRDPVIYPTMAGSGPMPLFVKRLGIPMVTAGVGYWGSANHAPNENIRVQDYLEGIKVIARIMADYAAHPSP